jgi:hypothetical protein
MSVAFGFAGLAFGVFTVWRLVKGQPKPHKFPCFTLYEMNDYVGVHNFDLQGIKKGMKSAIVINDNTECDEDSIIFNGTGGSMGNQNIDNHLNSHLATSQAPFLVFYRVEKNVYYLVGEAVRFGNYRAKIEDSRIVYAFPMIFLGGRLKRKIYQCKMV